MQNLIVSNRDGVHIIEPKDILYLKAIGSYCLIKKVDGTVTKVAKNLKNVLSNLLNVNFLIKVHRSWVVNRNMMQGIVKSKDKAACDYLKLKNGELIKIPMGATKGIVELLKKNTDQEKIQEALNVLLDNFSEQERTVFVLQLLQTTSPPPDADKAELNKKILWPFK